MKSVKAKFAMTYFEQHAVSYTVNSAIVPSDITASIYCSFIKTVFRNIVQKHY
jgi:hypothetical protein